MLLKEITFTNTCFFFQFFILFYFISFKPFNTNVQIVQFLFLGIHAKLRPIFLKLSLTSVTVQRFINTASRNFVSQVNTKGLSRIIRGRQDLRTDTCKCEGDEKIYTRCLQIRSTPTANCIQMAIVTPRVTSRVITKPP